MELTTIEKIENIISDANKTVMKFIDQNDINAVNNVKFVILENCIKALAKEMDLLKISSRNKTGRVSTVPPKGKNAWSKPLQ